MGVVILMHDDQNIPYLAQRSVGIPMYDIGMVVGFKLLEDDKEYVEGVIISSEVKNTLEGSYVDYEVHVDSLNDVYILQEEDVEYCFDSIETKEIE